MLQGLVNGTSGLYPGLFESQRISMPYALVFPESACEGQGHGVRREAGRCLNGGEKRSIEDKALASSNSA